MKTRILLLLIMVMSCQSAIAATEEEIITAFRNDKAVQAEIERVRHGVKATQEEIQIVGLGSLCGVAGCSYTDLVIMKMKRGGVNLQSASVLATVTGRNGVIGKVTLMELRPKGMPDLKIENRIPPQESELKIEHRFPLPSPATDQPR